MDKNNNHIISKILAWVFIISIPPIGIFLLFKAYPNMPKNKRIATIICALVWFAIIIISGLSPNSSSDNNQTSVDVENTTIPENTLSANNDNSTTTEISTEPITITQAEPSIETIQETQTEAYTVVIQETQTQASKDNITETFITKNEEVSVANGTTYVLNTHTKKFHKTSCPEVKKIKDENLSYFTGNRSEIIQQGYLACKKCNP